MCISDSTATQAGTATFSVPSAPWDYTDRERRFDAEEKPFVVLIEDNTGDVLLVEEALREHQVDCNLTVVPDGEEAMKFFRDADANPASRLPALVLLDLNLPKCSGHEILEWIRRSSRFPTLPVVIVTSSQASSDLAQTKKLGATAYFHKPIHFEEFMNLGALVRNLL
jgi:chemotaxis family two-component system response regulator Rcp1